MTSTVLPASINFSNEEEKILEFWKSIKAFETSQMLNKNKPKYTFYDGPPFATGMPHYGHILAGTIKDIVTRYAHQSGFSVERRFGWDCHGLPIEYEIDRALGITGPADVEKMGIKKYNDECRSIVMRYSDAWETIVTRMGRWIDFEHDYKTMYPWFMESVWWVFQQLYAKGLVYRGVKVMPYSTKCNTPLSNFEAGQNYQDVQDPAVIVSFPLDEDPNVSLIAWTTTPWTLPSNLSVCVNPEMEYVKLKDNKTGKVYIMMQARICALYTKETDYTILEVMLGKTLEGKSYTPLFDYFASCKKKTGAFRVLCDSYVTSESGTGLVHQAPYFGEDDHRVCLTNGVITKDMEMICPVDASGCFTHEVTHFKGEYVKNADKHIIKHLKDNQRLVHQGTCNHSYPFCWRSDTPLIYKAVPTWFIRVEALADKLLENNAKTYWVPDFVKEKRFANWLRDARDWAVSRNRFWGTPMPLWVSEDFKEVVCIGSIEELAQLSGVKVEDLHRENVDHITIPSANGKGVLRRVSEVFDCWFESGSMPYAQVHYPFERQKDFDDGFPADFIAEGIDQTRGWFYTLMVISTALFDKPPFKNLIVNGHVLAADGQKMSKRKKNYPDPALIIEKYGADALRLYLINSPVVRASTLRFKEDGVHDVIKDVFLPWYNATRFLLHSSVDRYEMEVGGLGGISFSVDQIQASDNIMDRWILSYTQSLIKLVKDEMAAYRLYTVLPVLVKFVDELTNWYIRLNRNRLRGRTSPEDCLAAIHTLFYVLYKMVILLSPFVPFFTEFVYQQLRPRIQTPLGGIVTPESVHYLDLPHPDSSLSNPQMEESVSRMQSAVDLGRAIRNAAELPVKYPLKEVVLVHRSPEVLHSFEAVKSYIQEELNVRQIVLTTDKAAYGVQLSAIPDHKRLGSRLKNDYKQIMIELKAISDDKLEAFVETGSLKICGHELTSEDLSVVYTTGKKKEAELASVSKKSSVDSSKKQSGDTSGKKGKAKPDNKGKSEPVSNGEVDAGGPQYEAQSDPSGLLVLLNISLDQDQIDEGLAREIVNRIQKLRKKAGLQPEDPLHVFYETSSQELLHVMKEYHQLIMDTVQKPMTHGKPDKPETVIDEEISKIKSDNLNLWLCKPASLGMEPSCRFVDVELVSSDSETRKRGTILLENPRGENTLSVSDLDRHASVIFSSSTNLYAPLELHLHRESSPVSLITTATVTSVLNLHGKVIYAFPKC